MKKGVTLIELTVALGLAALFLLCASYLVNSYLKDFSKMTLKLNELQVRHFVLDRIQRDLRSADRIVSTNPSRLGLRSKEDIIYYDFFAGKVRRTKNGYVSYLTDTEDVRSLSFEHPRPGLVLIKLDEEIAGGYVRNGK